MYLEFPTITGARFDCLYRAWGAGTNLKRRPDQPLEPGRRVKTSLCNPRWRTLDKERSKTMLRAKSRRTRTALRCAWLLGCCVNQPRNKLASQEPCTTSLLVPHLLPPLPLGSSHLITSQLQCRHTRQEQLPRSGAHPPRVMHRSMLRCMRVQRISIQQLTSRVIAVCAEHQRSGQQTIQGRPDEGPAETTGLVQAPVLLELGGPRLFCFPHVPADDGVSGAHADQLGSLWSAQLPRVCAQRLVVHIGAMHHHPMHTAPVAHGLSDCIMALCDQGERVMIPRPILKAATNYNFMLPWNMSIDADGGINLPSWCELHPAGLHRWWSSTEANPARTRFKP